MRTKKKKFHTTPSWKFFVNENVFDLELISAFMFVQLKSSNKKNIKRKTKIYTENKSKKKIQPRTLFTPLKTTNIQLRACARSEFAYGMPINQLSTIYNILYVRSHPSKDHGKQSHSHIDTILSLAEVSSTWIVIKFGADLEYSWQWMHYAHPAFGSRHQLRCYHEVSTCLLQKKKNQSFSFARVKTQRKLKSHSPCCTPLRMRNVLSGCGSCRGYRFQQARPPICCRSPVGFLYSRRNPSPPLAFPSSVGSRIAAARSRTMPTTLFYNANITDVSTANWFFIFIRIIQLFVCVCMQRST